MAYTPDIKPLRPPTVDLGAYTRQAELHTINDNFAYLQELIGGDPATKADVNAGNIEPEPWRQALGIGRVVALSSVCISDTDLDPLASTVGIDQSAEIQAVLDLAMTEPLEVIWDVAVTAKALILYSNTSIRALPACGGKLANGADNAFISNYNYRSLNFGEPEDAIFDENIEIHGGIWNFNGSNQQHDTEAEGWMVGFRFFNVRNLTIEGAALYKPRTFIAHISNFSNVRWINNRAYVFVEGGFNFDGPHLNGPGRDLFIQNFIGDSQDDLVGLNADDGDSQSDGSPGLYAQGWVSNGPITGVTYDRIHFDDSGFGLRILSSSSAIDDVVIRDVFGVHGVHGMLIDNYSEAPQRMKDPGVGFIKRITLDGWSVRSAGNSGTYHGAIFPVSCNAERLIYRNIFRHDLGAQVTVPTWRVVKRAYDPDSDEFPFASCTVGEILIDGYEFKQLAGSETQQYHFSADRSVIGTVEMRNLKIDSIPGNSITGVLVDIRGGAAIGHLIIDGADIGDNLGALVGISSGTLGSWTIRNLQFPMWTDGGTSATTDVQKLPNSPADFRLKNSGALYPGYGDCMFRMANVLSPDVSISGYFTDESASFATTQIVLGSRSAAYGYRQARDGYAVAVLETSVILVINGGSTLDSVTPASAFVSGQEYYLELRTKGTAISAFVQQPDGLWLDGTGAWQALRVPCLTATDASKTGKNLWIGHSHTAAASTLKCRDVKVIEL